MDLYYDEIAEYFVGMDFTPTQRVGVALELFDAAENSSVSPQSFLQSLPVAATMTHLYALKTPVRQPVIIRAAIQSATCDT